MGQLRWQTYQGSLPEGAVSIFNSYTGRRDYVCKYKCLAGFYSDALGSYCHYPLHNTEKRSSSFEILVNIDHFEVLRWQSGLNGLVPRDSVRICGSKNLFVGKNKYSLGTVDETSRYFHLPWRGSVYSYDSYEVLTTIQDFESQRIYDVTYNTSKVEICHSLPQVLSESIMSNRKCSPVSKTTTITISKKRGEKVGPQWLHHSGGQDDSQDWTAHHPPFRSSSQ